MVAVLERLKAWNRGVDAGETATLYQLFEDRLWHRAFSDDFADGLFHRFYQWAGAERAAGLYAILGDPASRWWDDIGTVERRESRDDIYLLAADDAGARAGGCHRLGAAGIRCTPPPSPIRSAPAAGCWRGSSIAARCLSPATARP